MRVLEKSVVNKTSWTLGGVTGSLPGKPAHSSSGARSAPVKIAPRAKSGPLAIGGGTG